MLVTEQGIFCRPSKCFTSWAMNLAIYPFGFCTFTLSHFCMSCFIGILQPPTVQSPLPLIPRGYMPQATMPVSNHPQRSKIKPSSLSSLKKAGRVIGKHYSLPMLSVPPPSSYTYHLLVCLWNDSLRSIGMDVVMPPFRATLVVLTLSHR